MKAGRRDLIDLSHPVQQGVDTYPGFPPPVMRHHISFEESAGLIAEGRKFAVDLITLVGSSSTYMDAPRHFDPDGADIAAVPLDRLVDVPAVVVRAPSGGRREYLPSDFAGLELADHAVLLATGWDVKWATPAYPTGSPYLGPRAAHHLVDARVAFVGIDAVLIDDVDDACLPLREAHSSLLGAGIPIIENMTRLTFLPRTGARVTAAPAAVRGVGSFPVRVFAYAF